MPVAAWQVICEQRLGGEDMVNTYAVDLGAAPVAFTVANAQAIADEFASLYTLGAGVAPNRGLDAERSTMHFLTRIVVVNLNAFPLERFEFAYNNPGSNANDALPNQVALVVSLGAQAGGRRGRGRVFLGGLTEDASIDSGGVARVADPTRAAVLNAFVDLCSRLGALVPARDLQVWSRTDNVVRDVAVVKVDDRWDTQKRRASQLRSTASNIAAV